MLVVTVKLTSDSLRIWDVMGSDLIAVASWFPSVTAEYHIQPHPMLHNVLNTGLMNPVHHFNAVPQSKAGP
jgi:hypothetical protein